MKTLLVRTLEQWRDWIAQHHSSESEVWLIFHKRHTGLASIAYKDARDEALCFGWVDSLVKRLDDRRYAKKFTPRRAASRGGGAGALCFVGATVSSSAWMTDGTHKSSRRGERTADGRASIGSVTPNSKP